MHLYQTDPRNRRLRSFDTANHFFRIGRLVFGFLVRTSSFPEIWRNTHRGKDTERDLFVLEKVWCTKAKSFDHTGLFLYGIEYVFCQHWNSSWRSIPFCKSVFETLAFVSMTWPQANFTFFEYLGVMCYPNRLSTYPTKIYDPSKPLFAISQKFPWAILK